MRLKKRYLLIGGFATAGLFTYLKRDAILVKLIHLAFDGVEDDEPNDQVIASHQVHDYLSLMKTPDRRRTDNPPPLAFLMTPAGRKLAEDAMKEWVSFKETARANPMSPLTGEPLRMSDEHTSE